MAMNTLGLSFLPLLLPFCGGGNFRTGLIPGDRSVGGLPLRYYRHSHHLLFRFKQNVH